LTRNTQSFKI